MSSKEQTRSNDKESAKQRLAEPATENLAQQQPHPATIIQRAKLAPRSLTPDDVIQLQSLIGNQAANRLLAQTAKHQPIQNKENKTGFPRFTDGESCIDLGMVASQAQGETLAPEKHIEDKNGPIQRVIRIGNKKLKSRRNISQLWRADEIDEHLGLGPEEKKKFQSELQLLAEGKNITEFPGWDEAYTHLREPKILIKGDDGVVSIIKNTTDLMIWLESYPLSSKNQSGTYAETATLQYALNLLKTVKKTITNRKVWLAVAVAQKRKSSGRDTGDEWGELDLVDSFDLLGKTVKNAVPGRYKRKIPFDEYQEKMQKLRSSLKNYKLVGLHATTMENTGALVKEGVSQDRFNTGHGVGKGDGFYIIPASIVTPKTIKEAKAWGSHVLAVFLPASAEQEWAEEGDNVQTLETQNTKNESLYYIFGKSEAVIPPSLCSQVKIVVDPADISMGDTKYEAESYDDEFGFLEDL